MSHTTETRRLFEGRSISIDRISWSDDEGRVTSKEFATVSAAVVIVPVDEAGRLVLIRNTRVAIREQLWELPAGGIDAGEPPLVAARRELEEETGFVAATFDDLGSFYSSPGLTTELMHVYRASGLRHVGQQLQPGERIEVHALAHEDVLQMIGRGEIRDGKSLAGLLLHLRYDEMPPRKGADELAGS